MRFRCYKCPIIAPGLFGEFFEFEEDNPVCPKCGTMGKSVVELTDVHLLVQHPHGQVQGDGVRYNIGCMPTREVLAMNMQDTFSCSEDPRVTTCPSCKGLPAWKGLAEVYAKMDRDFRQKLLIEKRGCC